MAPRPPSPSPFSHCITSFWYLSNIFRYSAKSYLIFASIFASRWNTLTSNHHIFTSPTIRLRYQSFGLHPNDEYWIGTPLRQNLVYISLNLQGSGVWVPPPPWHMIMSLKLFYSCECMRNILGLEWLKYTTNITIHFYSELKIKWDIYCQLRGMCLFFDI